MCTISFTLPYNNIPDIPDLSAYARKATALQLYKDGQGSLGYCAQFAGMSEFDFIDFLSENNIPSLRESKDELLEDFKNAHKYCNC